MAAETAVRERAASKAVAGKRKLNKTKVNVILDLLLTGMFIVEMEEQFTGLALHELIGLVFTAAFVLHIVLHWGWIVSITRTFFKKVLHDSRLNYVLNVALFADMAFATVSGILISHTLGLSLPLDEGARQTLKTLHLVSAELVLVLVALHVALHSAVVVVGGVWLGWQGDLISPVETTTLVVGLAMGDGGLAQPAEEAAAPAPAETASAAARPDPALTLDTFMAALAAEGVDVEQVSADMAS